MTARPLFDDAQTLAPSLLRLDPASFQRLRTDRSLTILAIAVMVGSVLLAGLGSYLWVGIEFEWSGEYFAKAVLVGGFLTLAGWVGVTALVMVLLRRDVPSVTFDQALRVCGVGLAPFALSLLAFIPELNYGIAIAAFGLTAAFLVVAIQLAFDVAPGRAFMAAAIPMAAWAILLPLFVTADDPFGVGIFGFDLSNEVYETLADFFGS